MNLTILQGTYAICRFSTNETIPQQIYASSFYSITKTVEEISIVVEESLVPDKTSKVEKNWRIFKVEGPLDFGLTGILNSLTRPIAEAGISIFAISTFDTDYIMVKESKLDLVVEVLEKSGHVVTRN
jgi:hypothetical protein